MIVEENSKVSIEYKIYSEEGDFLEENSTTFIVGKNEVFERVEEALRGKTVGNTLEIYLNPADAFGEISGDLIITESKKEFEKMGLEVEVGSELALEYEGFKRNYKVVAIKGDEISLEGNHPFAGKKIRYEAIITNIEE